MNLDQYIARAWPCWFVGFTDDGSRDYLVDRLSPPGFQHCLAFAFEPDSGRWIVYETNRSGCAFLVLDEDQIVVWLTLQKQANKMRVLKVTTDAQKGRFPFSTGMWCVLSVKHLVGSRSRALTPAALWRDLIKEGATEAFIESV
jgi:hypothetical protein